MQTAKILGSETFRYTEPITLVGLFFLVMSLVSAALIRPAGALLNRRSRAMNATDNRWCASTRSPSAMAR